MSDELAQKKTLALDLLSKGTVGPIAKFERPGGSRMATRQVKHKASIPARLRVFVRLRLLSPDDNSPTVSHPNACAGLAANFGLGHHAAVARGVLAARRSIRDGAQETDPLAVFQLKHGAKVCSAERDVLPAVRQGALRRHA